MVDNQQNIIITYQVEAKTALEKAQEFSKATEDMKKQMLDLQKQSQLSFIAIANGMKRAAEEGEKFGVAFNVEDTAKEIALLKSAISEAYKRIKSDRSESIKQQEAEINQYKILQKEAANFTQQEKRKQVQYREAEIAQQIMLMKELGMITGQTTQGFRLFGIEFGQLGTIARNVLGPLLGVYSAVQLLRSAFNFLKEAAVAAKELAQGMFYLETGVRALQRSGIDITIKDIYTNIEKLRAEFGIFSRKELIQGSGALLNLIRDLGLTGDQILELQGQIATLAVVNGRSMDEVQKTVALALSSGYTEGLQRLGVSINRVTIAMEAQRLGFGRNYMSLTEQQRSIATYNLILEKTAKFSKDLLEYQKTLPGAYEAATKRIEDATASLGEASLPILIQLKETWASIIENMAKAVIYARLYPMGGVPGGALPELPLESTLGDLDWAERMAAKLTAEIETVEETIDGKIEEITSLWDDYHEDLLDAETDFWRDMNRIDRDELKRIEELHIQTTQNIEKIWRGAQHDILDALDRYYLDYAQINRQFNEKRQDANDKYREKELEAEEDFAEKLRRLKEDFLFDLEDALRERDARQVLRLIRDYNLNKDRLLRDQEKEKAERNRAYKKELQDLEKQRADKLRNLKEELDLRLKLINENAKRQVEEQRIREQQELEELKRNFENQRQERKISYSLQRKDLYDHFTKEMNLIAKSLAGQRRLLTAHWDHVYKIFSAYIGEGGAIDDLLKYFYNSLQNAPTAAPSSPQLPGFQPVRPPGAGGFAAGGTVIARKPSIALFAERGPEAATFTPLGKGSSFGGGGKVDIRLTLSPELRAEIIDSTLAEVTDVVVSLQRERVR